MIFAYRMVLNETNLTYIQYMRCEAKWLGRDWETDEEHGKYCVKVDF